MKTILSASAVALCAFALPACAGNSGTDGASVDSNEADSLASTSAYFIVTRQDMRKCMSPICGGNYVKRVNFSTTKCADDTVAAECHAYSMDLSAIGLDDAETTKLGGIVSDAHALVRGTLVKRMQANFLVDVLVASEVWVGNSLTTPTGTFYEVKDNGVRCFAFPCASDHEAKLNSTSSQSLAGVDLSQASGANQRQVDAAIEALHHGFVLIAGRHHTVHGPGGSMHELVASEFYTKIVAPPPPGPKTCGGFVGGLCDTGELCDITIQNACNGADLPGVCKPVPQVCYFLYKPVCACNGQTYTNDCFRQSAKVQLAHEGACP